MTVYAAFLVGYLLLLVSVSFLYGRRIHSQEDFSVAGRSLPTMVVFLTMLSTWIGTGSLFGNAEETYKVGIAALVIPLGEMAGIALLIMLAGRARNLEQITIQDILEKRYNAWARLFGSITLIITAVIIVSYQYRAAEAVIHYAVPALNSGTARFLAVTFIILFTAVAGMFSVAYVDVIMGVTMFAGLSLALPVFWHEAGGMQGAMNSMPPGHSRLWGTFSFLQILNLTLPPLLLVLGDANMYQRFFSARSASIARKATFLTLIGVMVIETLIIVTAWFGTALVWRFYPAATSVTGTIVHLGDITGMDAVIPITLFSTFLLVVVSLLTPEPVAEQLEAFHGKMRLENDTLGRHQRGPGQNPAAITE